MIGANSTARGTRRGVYHLQLTCIYGLDAVGQGDPPIRLTRPYVISLAL
jgi:hypothetical protein